MLKTKPQKQNSPIVVQLSSLVEWLLCEGQYLVGSNPSGICIIDDLYQKQNSILVLLVLSCLAFDQQNNRTNCMPLNFCCKNN